MMLLFHELPKLRVLYHLVFTGNSLVTLTLVLCRCCLLLVVVDDTPHVSLSASG